MSPLPDAAGTVLRPGSTEIRQFFASRPVLNKFRNSRVGMGSGDTRKTETASRDPVFNYGPIAACSELEILKQ